LLKILNYYIFFFFSIFYQQNKYVKPLNKDEEYDDTNLATIRGPPGPPGDSGRDGNAFFLTD
jgi:hypothetical protein